MKKVILIMTLMVPVFSVYAPAGTEEDKVPSSFYIKCETAEEIITRVLRDNCVSEEMIEIIVAQAKHESDVFSSRIFVENHNCFGMKLASKRFTTATGINRRHAVYDSVEDCVVDYVLWMEARCIEKDIDDEIVYVKLLKMKHYFEDDVNKYTRSVTKFKEGV